MPETAKNTLKARTDAHSDVADTPAARTLQTEMTERQMGALLLAKLREAKDGSVRFSHLQEEWHPTDNGLMLEISVAVETESDGYSSQPKSAPVTEEAEDAE